MSNPITRYVRYDQSHKITSGEETKARHAEDVIVARLEKPTRFGAIFGSQKEVIVFSRVPAHKIKITHKDGRFGPEGCELGSPKLAFAYIMQRIDESKNLRPGQRELLKSTLRGSCRGGLMGDHRRPAHTLPPSSGDRLSPENFELFFARIAQKDKKGGAPAKPATAKSDVPQKIRN